MLTQSMAKVLKEVKCRKQIKCVQKERKCHGRSASTSTLSVGSFRSPATHTFMRICIWRCILMSRRLLNSLLDVYLFVQDRRCHSDVTWARWCAVQLRNLLRFHLFFTITHSVNCRARQSPMFTNS
jgi:hypothetical protein